MRPWLFLTLPLVVLLGSPCTAQSASEASGYRGKVSSLRVEAETFGKDWQGPTGLVVDDFQNTEALPPEVRQVAELLKKQVTPLGVIAAADFTYRSKSDPFDQITLRIFVFASEKSCRDWWQKKYQFDGWEKLYSPIKDRPYRAMDSKETDKRIVSFNNVLMTCGSLKKSQVHLKVLDQYLKKVQAAIPGAKDSAQP